MSIMGELKAQTLRNRKDLSFVVDHLGKLTQSHHQLGERDIFGIKPAKIRQFTPTELDDQITRCHKRKSFVPN
ncbi:unnamed protein product, partial [Aphanomyces euteiches]